MTASLVIDRHAFASNASSFNTAWETFGWTPAIEGARAGRLEEQVPWATSAARADDPPRLSGAAEQVLSPANYDRLGSGFLPLDGRFGFAIWGAIGERRRGAEWRVLTHTLLIDTDAFDVLAGYPQGLLTVASASSWFREMVAGETFASPQPLDPVQVARTRATRSAFERARRDEIHRLRDRLIPPFGGEEGLEDALAIVLEALARTRSGGPIRHVALRTAADRRSELLIKLAWLALPLADRAETWFLTEQRRTETPRATLFALAESEWGHFVPQATQLVDGRRGEASEGRRRWARSIARPAESGDHARLWARAEVRGWRVIARDDVAAADRTAAWRERWREGGDRLTLARELLAMQADPGQRSSRPRLRAAGHVSALAVAGRLDAQATLSAAFRAYPHAAATLVTSAIRTLRRGDSAARITALRLRCDAAAGDSPLTAHDELFRLLERERDLLPVAATDPATARSLLRAAAAVGFDGHPAAVTLIEAAMPGLDRLGDTLLDLARSSDLSEPRAARLVVQVMDAALKARPADVALARLVRDALLPALEHGAADPVRAFAISEPVLDAATASGSGVDPASLFAATRSPAAIAAVLRNRPPASDLAAWVHLLDRIDARTLVDDPVLDVLLAYFTERHGERPATGARAREKADRAAPDGPITKLLGRLFVGMGGRMPSAPQSERLLRLMWLERETTGDAARAFVAVDPQRALPLLAALLVAPAPLPLFFRLRRLLLENVQRLHDASGMTPLVPALEAYCPALAERVARAGGSHTNEREVRWTPSV